MLQAYTSSPEAVESPFVIQSSRKAERRFMLPQEPAIEHDFAGEPLGGHQPLSDQADQPARDVLAKTR